jgi:hypothetical protein
VIESARLLQREKHHILRLLGVPLEVFPRQDSGRLWAPLAIGIGSVSTHHPSVTLP